MRILLFIFLLCTSIYGQQTVELCEGENHTYNYTSNVNVPGNYVWSVNNIVFNGNPFRITWTEVGDYEIKCIFTSLAGCVDSITYNVDVIACDQSTMYIPNAFTPDGNDKNDIFLVEGTNIQEVEIFVYNRWGELIFKSYSMDDGWDGKYKGVLCLQDVYVCLVKWKDIKNRNYQKVNYIVLIH